MTTMDWDALMQQAATATGVSGSREPVPADDYHCECIKAEGTNSSTGKPMVKTVFKIVGGPYDGRWIFNNYTLSMDNPNALAFFFTHMAAFGLDRNFFGARPSMQQVAAQLVGKHVNLKVGQREWNGEMRNEVKDTKPYLAATSPMQQFAPPMQAPPMQPTIAPQPIAQPQPQPVFTPPPAPPMAPAPPVAPVVQPPAPPAPPAPPEPPMAPPVAPPPSAPAF